LAETEGKKQINSLELEKNFKDAAMRQLNAALAELIHYDKNADAPKGGE
jgi:hypothetical protein